MCVCFKFKQLHWWCCSIHQSNCYYLSVFCWITVSSISTHLHFTFTVLFWHFLVSLQICCKHRLVQIPTPATHGNEWQRKLKGKQSSAGIQREDGKSRDLSFIAVHAGEPVLCIVFVNECSNHSVRSQNPSSHICKPATCWDVYNKQLKETCKESVSRHAERSRTINTDAHYEQKLKQKRETESLKRMYSKELKEEIKKKAVLNTPHQVVPVRTHCHPLIGSFLIPLPHGASVLMGRWHCAKSLRGLTGTESKQAQTLPADNLASPSIHRRKNIQKHGPIARACYTGV